MLYEVLMKVKYKNSIKTAASIEIRWHFVLTKAMQQTDSKLCVSFPALSPFLRLSPPPGARDYFFNLDETEGMYDLFDVPLLT